MALQSRRQPRKHERGAALLVSILLLFLMTAIAMAAMDTVATDMQVAGFQKQSQGALYAAEAGAAHARQVVRGLASRAERPTYPADFPDEANPVQLGIAADYVNGIQPRYYADPDPAEPIEYIGEGSRCSEGCNITLGGQKFNHTKWKINVEGRSSEGATKKIEVVATRLLAVGY